MEKQRILSIILSSVILVIQLLLSYTANATDIKGDINSDGKVNGYDLRTLSDYLLCIGDIPKDKALVPDMNNDRCIDVFDLCLMRQEMIETDRKLDYKVHSEQIFSGYTNTIFTSNDDERILVARSVPELYQYLSIFFDDALVDKYADIFTKKFFDDNILLLNILPQTKGNTPFFEIDSVDYSNRIITVSMNTLKVDDTKNIEAALFIQIEIPKVEYYANSVTWKIVEEITPTKPPVINDNRKIINVSNISQYPELPTGCEVTSLTMLLNYLGYQIDKINLAKNYLPKQDFYYSNGIYYGADFRTTFAGNPESEHSYGCLAPCIVTTANSYLNSIGSDSIVRNISGSDFDSLLTEYIDNDKPVLIWITSGNLHESSLTTKWTTPNGEQVQWRAYEHCVVLTGYDLDNGLIYVSDPMYNNIVYDYNKIKLRYNEMGRQSVYIN